MKVSTYAQGTPMWVELHTTDDTGALAFYSALFGWTDRPQQMPQVGTYHSQRLGEDDVCGIANQSAEERQHGAPPYWTVYLAVTDMASVAGRVPAAGGTLIVPPFSMGDHGSMAVIANPTGAVVALGQSEQGFTRMREPGTFTWTEVITDNPDRAAAFYRTVLDVPTEAMDMGAGVPPYTLLGPPRAQGAGIMRKPAEMGPVPNVWFIYFEVADTDSTVARARALGGTIVAEPTNILPGRFAIIRDPQGAAFGVIKSAPMPAA